MALCGAGGMIRGVVPASLALTAAVASSATAQSPAPDSGSRHSLSIGADLRERYEYVRHGDWGRDPADPGGYLLQRVMVHADLRLGTPVRAFVQLHSATNAGRNGGARPTDANHLDLHQAFGELTFGLGTVGELALRGGRQELAFGSSRLVSVREGPNVRRSFDGLRASYRRGRWRADVFGVLPVETDRGVFDDGSEAGQRFWGLYTTGPVARGLDLDVYYLGLVVPEAAFEQGTARERRHSLGMRAFGAGDGFDYDIELVWQWGSFGSGRIRAWTAASNLGYTMRGWPGRLRLGLKANVTSGDDDPAKPDLETFNPLFPRGAYFGEASLIGPQNHLDVHPSVDAHLTSRLLGSVDWDFFWRESPGDGLYRVSGAPQVSGAGNDECGIGSQLSGTIRWQVDPRLTVTTTYSHFFAGPYLRAAGLSGDVDFVATWVAVRL